MPQNRTAHVEHEAGPLRDSDKPPLAHAIYHTALLLLEMAGDSGSAAPDDGSMLTEEEALVLELGFIDDADSDAESDADQSPVPAGPLAPSPAAAGSGVAAGWCEGTVRTIGRGKGPNTGKMYGPLL